VHYFWMLFLLARGDDKAKNIAAGQIGALWGLTSFRELHQERLKGQRKSLSNKEDSVH
jgi:hypothetical protein